MLVYIHRDYEFPDLFRQTPNVDGKWGEFIFTYNNPQICDYLVVLNRPLTDIKVRCRKGGRILIIQEPPYERNFHLLNYFKYFDIIISDFKDDKFNILSEQAMLPWHINKNYGELKNSELNFNQKNKNVSWITSNVNQNPGHQPRLDFLKLLQETNFKIDLFGKGINPIKDKFDGINNYKYTLAIENYSAPNYWTEKISDAYLSFAMPIVYGCTNLDKYFPKNSYIEIDIHKPHEAIQIIESAVENKLWENNIESIKEARNLILDKYQFFPKIEELIRTHIAPTNKYTDVYIPLDSFNKGVFSKIKLILKKTMLSLNQKTSTTHQS